jgi:dolichol-phosphate mannosyltransferase
MRTLVCIPTYNERANLPSTLEQVLATVPDVDILVVDDGSPDGTGEVADGSHRADDLPVILAAVSSADVVLGSRWMPGGHVRNWPWRRLALSRGGNAYVRFMLRMPVSDATGGFRAYRAELLRRLDLDDVASAGYGFQVDVLWRAHSAGARVVEVPITFVERTAGESKMSRAIVVEAFLSVTRWGLHSRLRGQARGRAGAPTGPV